MTAVPTGPPNAIEPRCTIDPLPVFIPHIAASMAEPTISPTGFVGNKCFGVGILAEDNGTASPE